VIAVDDVSLVVEPGEIVGLIGANGAGKTTLLEAISGYVRPASGTVRVGDEILTGASPRRLARSGIRRSFQGVESFDDLSVSENLLVAQETLPAHSWPREMVRPTLPVLPPELTGLADRFGLGDDSSPNEPAGSTPAARRGACLRGPLSSSARRARARNNDETAGSHRSSATWSTTSACAAGRARRRHGHRACDRVVA
jgi:ABC-type Fe3+/spermidine/putrescine transport system ATPase subunit